MTKVSFIETIKVLNSKFYNLELHQKRLQRTANKFYGIAPFIDLTTIQIPVHLQQGLVKCRITYTDSIISVEFEPYAFKLLESFTLIDVNDISYEYKSTNRVALNELFEKRGKADDIIIINNGQVTDSSYANLVFENNQGFFTPKHCLLRGTKREQLLNEQKIIEADIKVNDLTSFKKVYLINSMIDIEDDISTSVLALRLPSDKV